MLFTFANFENNPEITRRVAVYLKTHCNIR